MGEQPTELFDIKVRGLKHVDRSRRVGWSWRRWCRCRGQGNRSRRVGWSRCRGQGNGIHGRYGGYWQLGNGIGERRCQGCDDRSEGWYRRGARRRVARLVAPVKMLEVQPNSQDSHRQDGAVDVQLGEPPALSRSTEAGRHCTALSHPTPFVISSFCALLLVVVCVSSRDLFAKNPPWT